MPTCCVGETCTVSGASAPVTHSARELGREAAPELAGLARIVRAVDADDVSGLRGSADAQTDPDTPCVDRSDQAARTSRTAPRRRTSHARAPCLVPWAYRLRTLARGGMKAERRTVRSSAARCSALPRSLADRSRTRPRTARRSTGPRRAAERRIARPSPGNATSPCLRRERPRADVAARQTTDVNAAAGGPRERARTQRVDGRARRNDVR